MKVSLSGSLAWLIKAAFIASPISSASSIVRFLSFKDGRPFSISKDLREIFSYKNEIRASGQILPDQLIFLLKCGFNSVEIDRTKKDTWLNIFKTDSRQDYQK